MFATSYDEVCDSRDREVWLAERNKGIGASEAAAILGLSPWESPLSVYARKLGALQATKEETEAMRWGTKLEPLILEEFGRETGRDVARDGVLIRSRARPWQLATLDGRQFDAKRTGNGRGLVEVKATSARAQDWNQGVPEYVQIQVQHQLDVSGFDWGSVVVLQHGNRLLWADVERNEALIESIRAAEQDFWDRVQHQQPPNPDGSPATREALRALYPRDTGEVIALPGELIELDLERCEMKDEIKLREARLDWIDNQFRAALGSASVGTLANGASYSYRLQKRAERIVAASEFRVLRRSKGRE
jgi:putative phage-type endonuclease